MARIFTAGFFNNATTAGMDFSGITAGMVFSTTTVRSGTYAMRISSLSSGNGKLARIQYASAASNNPHFFRFYFNYATLPSAENRIWVISNSSTGGATPKAWITIDNTGVLRLYDEDGQIGSASAVLSSGTWYRIEAKCDSSAAAGSHVVEAKINGSVFATASNRSISAGSHHCYFGGNLALETQTTGDWFFDDIAINDATGSYETDYPGEGATLCLFVNGAGSSADWTRGGADSGSNWGQVDEVTPNDSTDYISSNTLNQTDEYTVEDTPVAVTATDRVKVVHVLARFAGAGASANASFVLRLKDGVGGTVEESVAITPSTNVFRSNALDGALVGLPRLTLYGIPGTPSSQWTKTLLDAITVGVRLSATSTNAAQVTSLRVIVETAPASLRNRLLMGVG